jgi:hypothetical protein
MAKKQYDELKIQLMANAAVELLGLEILASRQKSSSPNFKRVLDMTEAFADTFIKRVNGEEEASEKEL